MTLPPDSHSHSQWSWDAPSGSMAGSCARAVELGLPAIAFTEHLDHTVMKLDAEVDDPHLVSLADADGSLLPPPLDVRGYHDSVASCRERFPQLTIVTGVEVGEPHWHASAVREVLRSGEFDLVLGSLHCLPHGDGFAEPEVLMRHTSPADVVRRYLAEVAELVSASNVFTVLAHIDYPIRSWRGAFDVSAFEDEFRAALTATARSGKALEITTRIPLHAQILRWWREAGGAAVTFGSDAHVPESVARGFADAARMAEAFGFRPGPDPHGFWSRA